MNDIKQILKLLAMVSLVIGIFFIVGVSITLISLEDGDKIEPTVYNSVESPNKEHHATVFEYNTGGATTGFKTYVSIVSKNEKTELLNNSIFEVSDHPSQNNIILKWVADNKLSIKFIAVGNFKTYLKLDSFKNISIIYE